MSWPDNYIGQDSETHWIIEKSRGFTNVGLLRTSESVRVYMYLVSSLQASPRSRIIGNTADPLTAQKTFLNNFENRCESQSKHSGRHQTISRHSVML